ncbi:hypothetical protein C8J56DRAFT_1007158 [Mycena floridula]|nr:hypothetical protein C8J56DRAFT_1007158 [Mycena floridula]
MDNIDIFAVTQLLYDQLPLQVSFGLSNIIKFIELIHILKPTISLSQKSHISSPPSHLTVNVHEFLVLALDIPDEICKLAWKTFRDMAWSFTPSAEVDLSIRTKHILLFLKHGLGQNIGTGQFLFNFYPPSRTCLDPGCKKCVEGHPDIIHDRELVKPSEFPVTVFTKEFGAVPGYSTSLYCRCCHTRFHPNHYVHSNVAFRTYYTHQYEFIQASEHYYMSSALCELFSTMMVTSWHFQRTSATNCARIFNCGIVNEEVQQHLPTDWKLSFDLDVDNFWDGFFLYSLLLDCHEQQPKVTLVLNHQAPSQAERVQPALQQRNMRMAGTGQEGWSHACQCCCYEWEDEEGNCYQIHSTVTDGVTIGHPCCSSHDCHKPLPNVKHRHCSDHATLDNQCAVVNCDCAVDKGFRTCSEPDHRALETYHLAQGKAMFQLKHRLERLRIEPTEGLGTDADEEAIMDLNGTIHLADTIDDRTCNDKPDTGNCKLKARFGHCRTHNEMLCVGSCGVILGQATFFGSEAPNGIRSFWMKLFPTKASLPAVLWHDNNCRVVAMLKNNIGPHLKHYFDHCALPVDVFHFKSKHKQANAWIGGFQAIVREMSVDRYNFFLDEMIKRRNRTIIKELYRRGKAPYNIPWEELLQPDI